MNAEELFLQVRHPAACKSSVPSATEHHRSWQNSSRKRSRTLRINYVLTGFPLVYYIYIIILCRLWKYNLVEELGCFK